MVLVLIWMRFLIPSRLHGVLHLGQPVQEIHRLAVQSLGLQGLPGPVLQVEQMLSQASRHLPGLPVLVVSEVCLQIPFNLPGRPLLVVQFHLMFRWFLIPYL